MVLAGIVVVDLGVLADALGHLLQALGGHGQGGEGAGAGAAVFEHRADARQAAMPGHPLQAGDDLILAAAERLGHLQVGFGADRHAMLVVLDEAPFESV
ncbi:hypothetical protein D3C76_1636210 [compost metagenome]